MTISILESSPHCVPSTDDDAQGLFDMPWADILAMRDRMARRYYYKFRQRIPLEEFMSAANLGVAIARRDFPQSSSGASFRPYLGRCILHRFHEMWHEQKKKVPRCTFTGFSLERLPTYAHFDRRHDAMRLLRHVWAITTPRNRAMLVCWLQGESDTAIGKRFGLDQTNVSRAIRKMLHDLQVWAWQGEGSPPPLRRRVTSLSSQDRQTIRRLAQEGWSVGALKRRYGCDRTFITQALHQANVTQEAG